MQQPELDLTIIADFLAEAAAPSDAARLGDPLAACSRDVNELAVPSYPRCVEGISRIAAYLDVTHAIGLRPATAATEAAFRKARTAVNSLRAWQDEVAYGARDGIRSNQARDTEMAAIFEAQLAELVPAGAQVVLWAGDGHVASHEIAGLVSFGTILRRDLGAAWAPVSLIAYRAEINWPRVPRPDDADPDSIAGRLHELGRPYLFLDPASPWLGPDDAWLGDQFSAAIYLDDSPPMKAIFW